MTVALLGASWVEPGSPLVTALQAQGVQVEALGIRGAPLARWSRHLASLRLEGRTAWIWEMGGNGAPSPVAVRAVHGELLRAGAQPTWVLPPAWPAPGPVADRRARTRAAVLRAGVPSVDLVRNLPITEVAADGVHLRRAGASRFARAAAVRLGGPRVPAWMIGAAGLGLLWWGLR